METNEKINIAELLKDCPSGTKLYSPIFGDVYLEKVRPNLAVVVTTLSNDKEEFLYDGRYGINGECVLFHSKENRDWSTFKRQFNDGDVVTNIEGVVIMYKGITTSGYCGSYVSLERYNQFIPHYKSYLNNIRLATEEEKQKLFVAIKANGYKWNEETKTLEKLKKEFPKTYEECCVALGMTFDYPEIRMVSIEECNIYSKFILLKRCRDAYWKIAGEQIGFGKPWKPNGSSGYCTYAILRNTGHIRKSRPYADSELLEFPTEEMRDAFYKNFKELIEECKELL